MSTICPGDSLGVLEPAARTPSCVVLTRETEMETLSPAWSQLLQRSARQELTQSPEWLLTWWRTYGGSQGRQLRLGCFYDGDRLIGLAPLLYRWHWYRGGIPFRRLEFLASGEPQAHGIYSNHLSVLAERGAEEKVAMQMVQALQEGAFGSWDEVVLPMMAGDTAMPGLLVQCFRAARLNAEATVTARAPYIPLPASWEAYLQSLTPNSRRNIRRSLKAFDQWSGNTTQLQCSTSSADLGKAQEVLFRLHHERWAGDEQSGVFHSPYFLYFHDHIMRALAERDSLELLWLSARGEPVAALYSMVWAGKVVAYQTGRRTDLPSHLRPGGVLLALAIRRAIEKNRSEFDLLADDAFYKQQFTSLSRPLVQVRAVRSCLVEHLRQLSRQCFAQFRRLRRNQAEVPPAHPQA